MSEPLDGLGASTVLRLDIVKDAQLVLNMPAASAVVRSSRELSLIRKKRSTGARMFKPARQRWLRYASFRPVMPANGASMADIAAAFDHLRQAIDKPVAVAIENVVRNSPDVALNRLNPLSFARDHGLDAARTVAGFLHATQAGLFDLSWSVVCPVCGGVLNSQTSLRHLRRDRYDCAFCLVECRPVLDDNVEVAFTISRRVRRIDGHDPECLPLWSYMRQAFFGSDLDLPDDLAPLLDGAVLDAVEIPPGARVDREVHTVPGQLIAFEPVGHISQRIDVAGEETAEPSSLTIVLQGRHTAIPATTIRPGPLRLTIDNRTGGRALPILWIAGQPLSDLIGRRVPFLTAKHLLCLQTFRDLFRTDVLEVDQGMTIRSLTFLFTDIRGSTELYETVGDLAAYGKVRRHFQLVAAIIAEEEGAVVKTIGDAVMATFPSPERGIAAALRIREGIEREGDGLRLKLALHEGPCLAVSLDERQDYFGQTVNIASRLQHLAAGSGLVASSTVAEADPVKDMLRQRGLDVCQQSAQLRGVGRAFTIYEIG